MQLDEIEAHARRPFRCPAETFDNRLDFGLIEGPRNGVTVGVGQRRAGDARASRSRVRIPLVPLVLPIR